jgi:hypothetical protein
MRVVHVVNRPGRYSRRGVGLSPQVDRLTRSTSAHQARHRGAAGRRRGRRRRGRGSGRSCAAGKGRRHAARSHDPGERADHHAGPADIEQLVAAKVAAATAPILASLATTTSALTALTAKNEIDARDALIASAITAGKIAPADRGLWETQYALPGGPGIVSAILAGTPKNARVPVTATGHAGGETSSDDEALYAQLFGEKASA